MKHISYFLVATLVLLLVVACNNTESISESTETSTDANISASQSEEKHNEGAMESISAVDVEDESAVSFLTDLPPSLPEKYSVVSPSLETLVPVGDDPNGFESDTVKITTEPTEIALDGTEEKFPATNTYYTIWNPSKSESCVFAEIAVGEAQYERRLTYQDLVIFQETEESTHGSPFYRSGGNVFWTDDTHIVFWGVKESGILDTLTGEIAELFPNMPDNDFREVISYSLDHHAAFLRLVNRYSDEQSIDTYYYADLNTQEYYPLFSQPTGLDGQPGNTCWWTNDDSFSYIHNNVNYQDEIAGEITELNLKTFDKKVRICTFWDTRFIASQGPRLLFNTNTWPAGFNNWEERYPGYDFLAVPGSIIYHMETDELVILPGEIGIGWYENFAVTKRDGILRFYDMNKSTVYEYDVQAILDEHIYKGVDIIQEPFVGTVSIQIGTNRYFANPLG